MTGRWLSRDVIDLWSEWPEYEFCGADSILKFDCLGLLLDEVPAIDDIISFGVDALRNVSEINLSEDILALVSDDPAMVNLDAKIVDKVSQHAKDMLYPLRSANLTLISLSGKEKPELISFGGARSSENMIDQLKGFWKAEYRATWRVGANPLTWMIRNTHVSSIWKAYVLFDCYSYNGYVDISHSFDDKLDLRPHRHDKDDYRLLLNPREDAYDAITIILGAIWHDILGRRDDLHVKGQWHKIQMFGGVW